MQNVINLLDQLFQRTKNPKYAILLNEINSKKMFINNILNRKELKISDVPASLTVIIPTMWKCPADYFQFNLDVLANNNSVRKILIIDNSPLDNYLVIKDKKIQLIQNETNIGVNPAWNQGIEQTNSKYYLLLNDDCLVNGDIISAGVTILNEDKEVGIVNCHTKKIPRKDYEAVRKRFFKVEYANHVGANPNGWFIMGRTKDYKPIPKELVYFYGDNLIHHNAVKAGKRIVKIISDYISHDVSTTVNILDLYRKGLLETEGQFYRRYIGD